MNIFIRIFFATLVFNMGVLSAADDEHKKKTVSFSQEESKEIDSFKKRLYLKKMNLEKNKIHTNETGAINFIKKNPSVALQLTQSKNNVLHLSVIADAPGVVAYILSNSKDAAELQKQKNHREETPYDIHQRFAKDHQTFLQKNKEEIQQIKAKLEEEGISKETQETLNEELLRAQASMLFKETSIAQQKEIQELFENYKAE